MTDAKDFSAAGTSSDEQSDSLNTPDVSAMLEGLEELPVHEHPRVFSKIYNHLNSELERSRT